jgi:hypothetical protein
MCVFGMVGAEESVLIDFSQLLGDLPVGSQLQHSDTIIDFSSTAGSGFSAEERAEMQSSLAISQWGIELASSSQTSENQRNTLVREAVVQPNAERFANETVLGLRVHFPSMPINSWALLKPPFDIPPYASAEGAAGTQSDKFVGYGVVHNVGILKSLSLNVYGLNYPHTVSVVLENDRYEQQEIFLGSLEFDGWRTLVWNNPNYLEDVRLRDIHVYPLYPSYTPFVKLVGIRFYRLGSEDGGDFVSYVKDVSVTYDLAEIEIERDIDDESVWGILEARERRRKDAELQHIGTRKLLEYIESNKLHVEDEIQQQ